MSIYLMMQIHLESFTLYKVKISSKYEGSLWSPNSMWVHGIVSILLCRQIYSIDQGIVVIQQNKGIVVILSTLSFIIIYLFIFWQGRSAAWVTMAFIPPILVNFRIACFIYLLRLFGIVAVEFLTLAFVFLILYLCKIKHKNWCRREYHQAVG